MNEYANAWVKFVTKMWHQFCRFGSSRHTTGTILSTFTHVTVIVRSLSRLLLVNHSLVSIHRPQLHKSYERISVFPFAACFVAVVGQNSFFI